MEGEMFSLDITMFHTCCQTVSKHPAYEPLVLSSSSPRVLTVPPSLYPHPSYVPKQPLINVEHDNRKCAFNTVRQHMKQP